MHELSLVQSIVDQVERQVQANNAQNVERIELEIGRLAGVEWQSFDFAWAPTVKNTALEKAERVVHFLPASATCQDCKTTFEKSGHYEACPHCGSYLHTLSSGKELKVKSIVIH